MQNIKSKDNEKYQVSLLTAFNCTKSWKVFNLINYMTINIPNNTCSAVKKRHYFLLPCTAILSNWEGQKVEFKSIDLPPRLFCRAGSTIFFYCSFYLRPNSDRMLLVLYLDLGLNVHCQSGRLLYGEIRGAPYQQPGRPGKVKLWNWSHSFRSNLPGF